MPQNPPFHPVTEKLQNRSAQPPGRSPQQPAPPPYRPNMALPVQPMMHAAAKQQPAPLPYRPNMALPVQPMMHAAAKQQPAPPPYRPNMALPVQPMMRAAAKQPLAPPPYRPNTALPVQPMMRVAAKPQSAPPPYRPNMTLPLQPMMSVTRAPQIVPPPTPNAAQPPLPGVINSGVIQPAIGKNKRIRRSAYNRTHYGDSRFRIIRHRRRLLSGFMTKAKLGINLFTVKYSKNGKAYYLTTRSVPSTNKANFFLDPGHSEQRFSLIRRGFEQRHKLKLSQIEWAVTEREPCGCGPGMANCRHTLSNLGIPEAKVHYLSPYPDGEDYRTSPSQSKSKINEIATEEREHYSQQFLTEIQSLRDPGYTSDDDSEDESDIVAVEYESDNDEYIAPRAKRGKSRLKGDTYGK